MVDGVKRIIWASVVVVLTLLVAGFFRQPHRQPLKQSSPARLPAGQSVGEPSTSVPVTEGNVPRVPVTGSPLQLQTPARPEPRGGILRGEDLPLERRSKPEAIRSQSRIESEPPPAPRTQGGELPPAIDERYQPLGGVLSSPTAAPRGAPASSP